MADAAETKKPVMVSSVDLYRKTVEARNAAQQNDLQFQTPEAIKKLTSAVEALQKQLEAIRFRVEELETAASEPLR